MLLPFLSGILLFLSFPPFPCGFFAWIAAVPLLVSLKEAGSRGDAFLKGYVAGIVFFAVSMIWLTNVTAIGWIALAAYQAIYAGLFALLVYEGRRLSETPKVFWIALAWTACEFLRAKPPGIGLGWNLLGHTQASYSVMVQAANTVGVFGTGFIVIFVSASIAVCLNLNLNRPKPVFTFHKVPAALALLALIMTIGHGIYHQGKTGKHLGDWRISVLQGNIPQSVKWEAMARDKINEIYLKLTELAAYDKTDLIIWPEAAFPGYFNRDWDAQPVRDMVKKIQIPTLIGTTLWEEPEAAYNSAVLLGVDGQETGRYDKEMLVPFGEYVPLKFLMGDFKAFAESLGISDFSFGREKTVFQLFNGEISFSTLICFEDVFPELSQAFVDRGANFLAVITNDAWFGHSGAAAQHVQASIFRAVEQGVPVVRAANTGISGFISNTGKLLGQIENEKGDPLFIMGHKTMTLSINNKETLYRKGGWIFPYLACAAFVMMFLVVRFKKTYA